MYFKSFKIIISTTSSKKLLTLFRYSNDIMSLLLNTSFFFYFSFCKFRTHFNHSSMKYVYYINSKRDFVYSSMDTFSTKKSFSELPNLSMNLPKTDSLLSFLPSVNPYIGLLIECPHAPLFF